MVASCCVKGCKSAYSKFSYISFHVFPKDPERRKEWTLAIGRKNFTPKDHTVICSKHFVESDFERLFPTHVLKKTAVPCKENRDVVTKIGYSPSLSNIVTNLNRRPKINCRVVKAKKFIKNETENIDSITAEIDCSTPTSLNTVTNCDNRPEVNCSVVKKSAIPILYEASRQLLKKFEKKETENIGSMVTEINCTLNNVGNSDNGPEVNCKSTMPILYETSLQLLKEIVKNEAVVTPSSLNTVANYDSKRPKSPIPKKYRYFGDFKEEDLNDRENVKLMWLAAKKSIALKNRQLKYLRTRNRYLNAKINTLKMALKLRIKSEIN